MREKGLNCIKKITSNFKIKQGMYIIAFCLEFWGAISSIIDIMEIEIWS